MQVVVPAGLRVGLKLMTVLGRPVVASVDSPELVAQGVRPQDALVGIKGRRIGDVSAQEAADLLRKAKWESAFLYKGT